MAWLFIHEIGRKIIHLTILIVLFGYVFLENNYGKQAALMALVILLGIFLILEYFRLELNMNLPFFYKFVRPSEQDRMYGVIYFLSATIICLAVFDFKIAIAALLMTTFGDMVAAIMGKKFGVTTVFRNKTVVGSVSELIVNLIIGLILLNNFYLIITMALTSTLVEVFVDKLDDNLMVPLFTGLVGQLLYQLL